MHICFIIGAMNYSGAEKVLTIISRELYDKENKVSIILLDKKKCEFEDVDGINICGVKETGSRINRIVHRWRNIREKIKQIKPDIIVSFGFVCNVNSVPALIGVKYPLILCERNDPVFDPRRVNERLSRWLLYRFADGYVFQTEKIKSYFSNKIQKKAVIIENPIVQTNIKWDSCIHSKSIATVARLDNFQKDHIVMFNAFKNFLKEFPEYTLEVYGDGPDRKQYEKVIASMGLGKKVILHGKINDTYKEIANSEIFLFTSRYEGMPNALMEALSIGMPCVSTDCGGGGAKALFDITQSGILVPVGDVGAISQALTRLVEDDELKSELSRKALQINVCLDNRRICKKWETFLKAMISKKISSFLI